MSLSEDQVLIVETARAVCAEFFVPSRQTVVSLGPDGP